MRELRNRSLNTKRIRSSRHASPSAHKIAFREIGITNTRTFEWYSVQSLSNGLSHHVRCSPSWRHPLLLAEGFPRVKVIGRPKRLSFRALRIKLSGDGLRYTDPPINTSQLVSCLRGHANSATSNTDQILGVCHNCDVENELVWATSMAALTTTGRVPSVPSQDQRVCVSSRAISSGVPWFIEHSGNDGESNWKCSFKPAIFQTTLGYWTS